MSRGSRWFLRFVAAAALAVSASRAPAQVAFPVVQAPVPVFAAEDKDWGVEPTSSFKRSRYHSPTPVSIPGGRVIRTVELKALLEQNKDVLVIDVLDSKERTTVPGAVWLPGAGEGALFAAEKARFAQALERIAGTDRTRPLVFLCFNAECWLSYNAALHAMEAGWKDVIWYRGGTEAWRGAKERVAPPRRESF